MINYFWFFSAALFEIAGCYGFWLWLRLGKSSLWLLPAVACLLLFGLILTRVEAEFAGRAYAAYGGVYIVSCLVWLTFIERSRPLFSDCLGAAMCLLGAAIILSGPRFFNAS
jgi:small multidrug resistance family-3 protein